MCKLLEECRYDFVFFLSVYLRRSEYTCVSVCIVSHHYSRIHICFYNLSVVQYSYGHEVHILKLVTLRLLIYLLIFLHIAEMLLPSLYHQCVIKMSRVIFTFIYQLL
jgi:hypothetical protein